MDINKLKPEKIVLPVIALVAGILSYGLIFNKFALSPTSAPGCPPAVKDADGNIYKTARIGSQCWMQENLKVTKNPRGKAITRLCYDNDPKNCDIYGGLYDWNTAMNGSTAEGARGICPNGWHVPKDSEWYALESGLAAGSCDETKLNPENILNCYEVVKKLRQGGSSGFEAKFAGTFAIMNDYDTGSFDWRDMGAFFWSSSESKPWVWIRVLTSTETTNYGTSGRGKFGKRQGFSVRCLKD